MSLTDTLKARFDFFTIIDSHADRSGSPGDGIAEIQGVAGSEKGNHDPQHQDSEAA